MNNVHRLHQNGVKLWLHISDLRDAASTQAAEWIETGIVSGMVIDPRAVRRGICQSTLLEGELLAALGAEPDAAPHELYDMVLADVARTQADRFGRLHRSSGGTEGFVAVDIAPDNCGNAQEMLAEAVFLRNLIDRPNAMIRLPLTLAGTRAVEMAVGIGIPVFACLAYSQDTLSGGLLACSAGLARSNGSEVPCRVAFHLSKIDLAAEKAVAPDSSAYGNVGLALAQRAYESVNGQQTEPAGRGHVAVGLVLADTRARSELGGETLYLRHALPPGGEALVSLQTLKAFEREERDSASGERAPADPTSVLEEAARYGLDLAGLGEHLQIAEMDTLAKVYGTTLATIQHRAKEYRRVRTSAVA